MEGLQSSSSVYDTLLLDHFFESTNKSLVDNEAAIMTENNAVSQSKLGITQERLEAFDEGSIAVLAERLDQDDYQCPFDGLNDWHWLRALAIHRPELTLPYLHLIDQEPFDED